MIFHIESFGSVEAALERTTSPAGLFYKVHFVCIDILLFP